VSNADSGVSDTIDLLNSEQTPAPSAADSSVGDTVALLNDEQGQPPAPNYSTDQGPLYIGPNDDGTHDVQTSDGQIYSLPWDALTPSLQSDAVQTVANQGSAQPLAANAALPQTDTGAPNLTQMSTKQQMELHNAMGAGGIGAQPANVAAATDNPGQFAATVPTGTPQPPTNPTTTTPPPAQKPLPMAPDTNTTLGAQPKVAAGGGSSSAAAPDQTTQDEIAAARAARDVATQKAGAQLRNATAQGIDLEDEAEDQAIKRQAIDKMTSDTLARAKTVADNFANQQIDPNRYWNSKSDAQKATARIAMILGGIGSGITGKDNPAVKAYNDAQDRDLAAQKFNIEHGKEASDVYSKLLSDFRATGLDQRQAHDATIATIKDKRLNDDEKAALAAGGAAAQAKFQAAVAPLHLENQQKIAAIAKTHADTAQALAGAAHTRAETAQLALQGGLQRDLMAAQSNLSKGYGYQQLPAEQQRALVRNAQANKMLVPGEGIAQREVQPQEQEKAQDLQTVNQLVADIDDLTRHTAVDPAARKQAANKAATLKAMLPKVLGSQARLSEGTMNALDNVVDEAPGDLFNLWQPTSKALRSSIGEVRRGFHKNLGLTPFTQIQETPRQ
jgi:hypothetical protein